MCYWYLRESKWSPVAVLCMSLIMYEMVCLLTTNGMDMAEFWWCITFILQISLDKPSPHTPVGWIKYKHTKFLIFSRDSDLTSSFVHPSLTLSVLMMLDDTWWCLMTLDDAWWQLMTIDDTWWYLMTLDKNKHY